MLNVPYCCSVAKSCPTLCNPMDCSMPGFPVLCCLLEFAQTHVRRLGDAIQHLIPCHPLLLLPSIFPIISLFHRVGSTGLFQQSRLCKSGDCGRTWLSSHFFDSVVLFKQSRVLVIFPIPSTFSDAGRVFTTPNELAIFNTDFYCVSCRLFILFILY